MSAPLAGPRLLRSIASLSATALLAHSALAQEPPPTYGVRGNVLDVARKPVAGAEVRLVLENERGAKLADTVRTDEAGRFLARGWIVQGGRGEGPWRIEVRSGWGAVSVVDAIVGGYGVDQIGPVFVFDPVTVRGHVTDASGQPVAGAAVRCAHGDAEWSRRDYARAVPDAVSGADGSFEFRSAPPGKATIGFAVSGFADAVLHDVVLRASDPNVVDVRLAPERPLAGSVVDAEGAPIARASVEVPARSFWRAESSTDSSGRFRVDGLGADWDGQWAVRATGFVGVECSGSPAPDARVTLRRSRSFTVRVLRTGAGPAPVIERVTLLEGGESSGCNMADTSFEVTPDPLTVQIVETNSWTIYFEAATSLHPYFRGPASGFAVRLTDGSWLHGDLPDPAREREPVVLSAAATGGITGRVVRLGDLQPVAGTTVMSNYFSVLGPHLVTVTDAVGRYSFDGMWACEAHSVQVDNESWYGRPAGVAVRAGEVTRDVDIVVHPQPRIVGRITVAGQTPGEPVLIGLGELQYGGPVPGGSFGLGQSDADGNYSVIPQYDRRLTVVAKRRTRPEDGGYRQFRLEFPEIRRGASWPWQVDAPARGEVRFDFDMPEWK